MMTGSTRLLATLAGAVVCFFMGFLLYAVLFDSFLTDHAGTATGVARGDDMVWWALIAGNVFIAYLLVYIFGKWAHIDTFGAGLSAGALIGLLMGLGSDLINYATANIVDLTAALVDPFIFAVMLSITGGVIGWILGRSK